MTNFTIFLLPAFAREASEGCRAGAHRAKAGARFASYGSASRPAIIFGASALSN